MLWLTKHNDFSEQYAKATDERAVGMFEDMFDIADDVVADPAEVSKAKLRVDTRKWALSRMNPKKYGDRATTVHEDPNGNNPFASLMDAVTAGGRPRPGGD